MYADVYQNKIRVHPRPILILRLILLANRFPSISTPLGDDI